MLRRKLLKIAEHGDPYVCSAGILPAVAGASPVARVRWSDPNRTLNRTRSRPARGQDAHAPAGGTPAQRKPDARALLAGGRGVLPSSYFLQTIIGILGLLHESNSRSICGPSCPPPPMNRSAWPLPASLLPARGIPGRLIVFPACGGRRGAVLTRRVVGRIRGARAC